MVRLNQTRLCPRKAIQCHFHMWICTWGLEFNDLDDAHSCYNAFSRRTSFSIQTNYTRLSNIERSLINVEYVCLREGSRRDNFKLKERARLDAAETKCECKEMMTIKNDGDKWVVFKFVL
ncbi:hypothetical protein CIPAW_05G225600 [Carya illinoinensis]|uniref:FAR1 domain-containing protein n=1 Tax=Carya illinoinensis TaxID=32201 RepID=A0A8T1QMP7_CARIL|nr:hypothetical protein CIPAW_05G225600 [Carya illinoinensis]